VGIVKESRDDQDRQEGCAAVSRAFLPLLTFDFMTLTKVFLPA
jgi:hypothetical protein